jgi:uncharacterized protein YeaO (DUF488 family)
LPDISRNFNQFDRVDGMELEVGKNAKLLGLQQATYHATITLMAQSRKLQNGCIFLYN